MSVNRTRYLGIGIKLAGYSDYKRVSDEISDYCEEHDLNWYDIHYNDLLGDDIRVIADGCNGNYIYLMRVLSEYPDKYYGKIEALEYTVDGIETLLFESIPLLYTAAKTIGQENNFDAGKVRLILLEHYS